MTAWYLNPGPLAIIERIRDHELVVCTKRDTYLTTADEWQRFDDVFVSSLDAWHEQDGRCSAIGAQQVACAATGQRLVGDWTDEAVLLRLRGEIDAALAGVGERDTISDPAELWSWDAHNGGPGDIIAYRIAKVRTL